MSQADSPELLQLVKSTAVTLTENLCPVVLLQPGLKKPMTDESQTWLTFDDPDQVAQALDKLHRDTRRVPNLGVLLHPKETSPLICVDVDGSNPRVTAQLQAMGVSRGEQSWRQVTPLRRQDVNCHNRVDHGRGCDLQRVERLVVSEDPWERIRAAGHIRRASQREEDATQDEQALDQC